MPTQSTIEQDNEFIAHQLTRYLEDKSYREIASVTGHHAETVRRYLRDASRISASFIRKSSSAYNIDANLLLHGRPAQVEEKDLRFVGTSSLLAELGRRITRVEDCMIGRSLANEVQAELEIHVCRDEPD